MKLNNELKEFELGLQRNISRFLQKKRSKKKSINAYEKKAIQGG